MILAEDDTEKLGGYQGKIKTAQISANKDHPTPDPIQRS
jgi:hypothetical protein